MELQDVKKFLESLKLSNIKFDSHFYKRAGERPITKEMVLSFLFRLDQLEKVEQGKKDRFKLWFKMSRKYSLVLIVEILNSKVLNIVSAWNTDRKWQKKLKK